MYRYGPYGRNPSQCESKPTGRMASERLNDTSQVQRQMPGGNRRAGLAVEGGIVNNSRFQNDVGLANQDSFGAFISPDRRRACCGQEDLEGAISNELHKKPQA